MHTDPLSSPGRLAALTASDLLDSGAIPALDRVVRTAARLLHVPVAQLNVLTADQQIPVSHVGGEGLAQPVELQHSFCRRVVESDEPLVIPDTREDPALATSAATKVAGVVAYLSVPIRSPRAAHPLASLCVADFQPRAWTEEDVSLLSDLAAWAATEIELRAGQRAARIQSQAALRSTEERLRLALEAAALGIWEHDLDTNLFTVDRRARELYSLPGTFEPERLIERVHPDDRQRLGAEIGAALDPAVRGAVDTAYRVVHPDGTVRHLRIQGLVAFSGEGADARALRGVGTVQDVTDQEGIQAALRESEANFRALADNIPQLAWMADRDGWIFWYNQRWYDYTGTTLPEMEGWGWKSVHHPDHVEGVARRFRQAIEAGQPWEDTFPLRGRDGGFRWFLSRALPIRSEAGEVIRWFGSNTDVTEQRTAAAERERLLEETEAARAAAEEANRAKSQFLGVMSHELRTPLNAILGYVDLLLARTQGSVTAGQEVQLERIRAGGRHLVELIEEILTYARLEAGREQVREEDVDLVALVEEAVEMIRPLAERKGLPVRTELPARPLSARTDGRKLRQIVLNLLSNAAKFTDRGAIDVRLRDQGGDVVIEVEDTGPGIPPAQIDSIWEPFHQIDSANTREKGGTGLGLAVSLQLARLLQGQLSVDSTLDRGSTFTLRLPRRSGSARVGDAGGKA